MRHLPAGLAVKTAVGGAGLLKAMDPAGRAGTALVQPIAVGIQAVLDVVVINMRVVAFGQASGGLPGSCLHHEQLKVRFVGGVSKDGVAQLVEQRPTIKTSIVDTTEAVGNCPVFGRPRKGLPGFKAELREIQLQLSEQALHGDSLEVQSNRIKQPVPIAELGEWGVSLALDFGSF